LPKGARSDSSRRQLARRLFASPEQFPAQVKPASLRASDIYSLGAPSGNRLWRTTPLSGGRRWRRSRQASLAAYQSRILTNAVPATGVALLCSIWLPSPVIAHNPRADLLDDLRCHRRLALPPAEEDQRWVTQPRGAVWPCWPTPAWSARPSGASAPGPSQGDRFDFVAPLLQENLSSTADAFFYAGMKTKSPPNWL